MSHFIMQNDKVWAGRHLIVEVYQAFNLDNVAYVRASLIEMAMQIRATVLGDFFHSFPGGGVTGVVALAESHISIHTWPETRYAAIDIFTCGSCNPRDGIETITKYLGTDAILVTELLRGEQFPH